MCQTSKARFVVNDERAFVERHHAALAHFPKRSGHCFASRSDDLGYLLVRERSIAAERAGGRVRPLAKQTCQFNEDRA